jgi:hypothetical protein
MSKAAKWSLVVASGCVLLYFLPSVGICSKTSDIDVNSGSMRRRTRVLFVPVKEETIKTLISEHSKGVHPGHDWRAVSFVVAWPDWLPHLRVSFDPPYHAVPVQIESLRTIWSTHELSEDERNQTAANLLRAWRESHDGMAGSAYISELNKKLSGF